MTKKRIIFAKNFNIIINNNNLFILNEKEKKLYEFLSGFITEDRKKRFEQVLQYRTRHFTIVLEDIYQSHNASAVLRSCDLTGIQDIHIIENKWVYDINPDIVVGSTKWLDLHKYNVEEFNTPEAFDHLHDMGYKIVATCPHNNDYTPDTLPLEEPIAIVFGTEKTGLSDYALEHADMYVQIPMYGFTESFNISVSAALLMYTLTQRLHKRDDISWRLTDDELELLRLDWTRKSLNRVRSFEDKFFEMHPEYKR